MSSSEHSQSPAQHWKSDPFYVENSNFNDTYEDEAALRAQPTTTKWELWGYYLYYNGDNGYTTFGFMATILQYLMTVAGQDPHTHLPCNVTNPSEDCNVLVGSSYIPVASVILYLTFISFALQFIIFTTFGGLADYGQWNKWILLVTTVIAITCQIIPVAFFDGSDWPAMAIITIISNVSYGATLVFYAAAFPIISDNLPIVRTARLDPTLTEDEKHLILEKWRNHVSTISTIWSNIGFLLVTGIMTGISFAPHVVQITNNGAGNFNQIGTAFSGAFWAVNAIFYFLWVPKGRSGPPIPRGYNVFTVGWKSITEALREAKRLKQAFIYIISYFMFSDATVTMNSLIQVIQNDITDFGGFKITLVNLVSAITSIIGCVLVLTIQKCFNLRTKTMLLSILIATLILPLWGSLGLIQIPGWHYGIRTEPELWVFYVWFGIGTAPIYAYQQTMLAELIPPGKEGLFFGLFGIVSRASAWIGPLVVALLNNTTGTGIWIGWPFCALLFFIPIVMIFFIDEDRARVDIEEYLHTEQIRNQTLEMPSRSFEEVKC